MPVLLGPRGEDATALPTSWGAGDLAVAGEVVEIGLVNNMPDGALEATERQFAGLLAAGSGERTVRLHRFAMPGVERGPGAAAHIAACYAEFSAMGDVPLDGLIVTGCEPRAASLADEPFWPSFTRLVDWAESNTVSTLWSCLAAHAAVLHLDGVQRHRMPVKRAGVFESHAVAPHPLLEGLDGPMRVAHSRWNDLRRTELEEHGYTVLTQSAQAGVDLFVKPWNSLFVFFQGHPEYDPDTLSREYRRDVARYLRGERPDYPGLPQNYFGAEAEAALESVRVLALADRRSVGLSDLPRGLGPSEAVASHWRQGCVPVFRAWIDLVAKNRRG